MALNNYDVVVVGGGNAGFTAATSAAQNGAKRVLLLEKAPEEWAGGNTFFTAGGFRTVFDGLPDLLPFLHGLDEETISKIEMEPYTKENFHSDISRITKGRANPALARELVDGSRSAIQWLVDNGIKFQLSFNRQAFSVNGIQKFWGGMVMNVIDGGKGLWKWHVDLAKRHGVEILYGTPAYKLETCPRTGGITGVHVHYKGGDSILIRTNNVILASGGFQGSPEMRTKYLGPGWDLAHVRGNPYNEGDGHRMAADAGAKLVGNWSGCHAVAWDANSPRPNGDRVLTNQFTKSGYPLGVMLNSTGNRFVDEGYDIRNFTYAYIGKEVLKQPQGFAFQVWDTKGASWLRKEEYAPDVTKRITAPTLEALADILVTKGLRDKEQFLKTIKEYNEATYLAANEKTDAKFDPAVLDGVSTQSSKNTLPVPKSNWAIPLDEGPYLAVEVTCGITFTFGGLAVDPKDSGVISKRTAKTIPGLYCCGEMVGDIFWDNYPGGSGLMMGSVLGLKAGRVAAQKAASTARISHL